MADSGVGDLLAEARRGSRRALARLITHIERDGDIAQRLGSLVAGEGAGTHLIGITGAPGAGKSSLTGQVVGQLVAAGRTPAVVAVDPSSPLTGGAILGDRVRMDAGAPDGVFIRSMATRGHRGGLAVAVPATLRLLAAVGFDPVIVETTGVGQVEVDIASAADTTVLVTAPGWGDAVQANKAGLLEVADVLVVNKADRPGARDARRDLELMLDLGHISGHEAHAGRRPEIVLTTATTGEGVVALCAAIDAHYNFVVANGLLSARRRRQRRLEIAALVERRLRTMTLLEMDSHAGREVLEAVDDARFSPAEAAATILARVIGGPSVPASAG